VKNEDGKRKTFPNFDREGFLCYHYETDPYKTIVPKQPVIFAEQIYFSLGDDGSKK